jgi:Leucine-rich repeat (LRR) protein
VGAGQKSKSFNYLCFKIMENDYYQSDLDVLQDIIDENELTTKPVAINGHTYFGYTPEDIGVQKWEEGRLSDLDLYNKQLTILPKSIGNLNNLKVLRLQNNQLNTLPRSIGNLNRLEWLVLSHNKITSIPENIGDLRSLKHLSLGDNQLMSLPMSIGELRSLEKLWLNNNQLMSLPYSICNLPSNCFIFLDNNYLREEFNYNCNSDWCWGWQKT